MERARVYRAGGVYTSHMDANELISRGQENLEIVKQYLASIESAAPFEEVAKHLAPDVVQTEFPNRLVPNGATRRLPDLAAAAASGKKVVSAQRYEIRNAVALGEHVALEVQWTGTLAVPFGTIPAGGRMTANFGVFLVVRDGRIQTQNNYDCFDPF
ncbi:MAG TPA: nuclear transport factor 2 family protein [Thermoanaerobaculia bacterium]|nr:nuclear transport factor 2 family protein [Thermoanaerobaculia bacterium]